MSKREWPKKFGEVCSCDFHILVFWGEWPTLPAESRPFLLDTLGPLRSCFDFHGVILSRHGRHQSRNTVGVTTEVRKG